MKKMDSYAYLAGLIDGDGSIYHVNDDGRFVIKVKVVSTDYDTILFIKERFGGNVFKEKTLYVVQWGSLKAIKIVNKIFKFLILKREQAEVVMSVGQGSSKNNVYYLKTKKLNHEERKNLKNPKMKQRLFWSYLGGLVDSDGSITIKNPKNYYSYLFLKITSKHKKFLEIIKTRVGSGCITQTKSWYDIKWTGMNAKYVVDKIIPFLISRKSRALIGMKFQILKNGKRDNSLVIEDIKNRFITEMRKLNSYNLGSCND